MPLVLFQLGLEAFKQRESISGGAGKAGDDLAVVQAADLARRALDHHAAKRYLAIAADSNLYTGRSLAAHTENGGSVKLFHSSGI